MQKTSLSQIAAWIGVPCPAAYADIEIDDIAKDSRLARKGSLFIPLPGTQFDGHDFAQRACQNGASATLWSKADTAPPSCPALAVADVRTAYQTIAAGYRRQFPLKVVGITGSVGKTTTAIMTAAVVSQKYTLLKTGADANGQIGLPFALFALDEGHEAAVLEMGMSQPGELSRLSRIAAPDIAVINTIGTAHIEFFGSREKIRDAKLEILEGMQPGGTVILNGDEPLLWELRGKLPQKTLYYGFENSGADIRGQVIESRADGIRFLVTYGSSTQEVFLPAAGVHNAANAMGAMGVAICMDIPLSKAAKALADYHPAHGRQNVSQKRGITIIDDCYNASPEAVCASLHVLKELPAARRFAVLGGMLELGDYEAQGHRLCGACAAQCADYLYTYADKGYYREGALAAGMPRERILPFASREELADALLHSVEAADAVLFKGSHGTHMEEALALFLAKVE